MKKSTKRNIKKTSKPSLFNKTLKILPVLFSVTAVIYLGLLIRDIEFPVVLPVTEVQVKGELNFIDKEEIKMLVKNNVSGGYFTVDLTAIRETLLHKPWVKNASLRRKWPASLTVFIEEQVPVAYWNNDAYLSENGDVFKPATIDIKLNLPNLNGPAGQHENVWKFMNILYKETAMLNYEVVWLNLDDRRAWQLVIEKTVDLATVDSEATASESTEIKIKLGRFDTEKRLQRFVNILPALTIGQAINKNDYATGKIKVIDMRYPNGFAVQLAENCSLHFPHSSRPCKSSEA